MSDETPSSDPSAAFTSRKLVSDISPYVSAVTAYTPAPQAAALVRSMSSSFLSVAFSLAGSGGGFGGEGTVDSSLFLSPADGSPVPTDGSLVPSDGSVKSGACLPIEDIVVLNLVNRGFPVLDSTIAGDVSCS